MISKPILAATLPVIEGTNPQLFDFSKIKFPIMVSGKLDGVRCLVGDDGELKSRAFKPFNSIWVNETIGDKNLAGLDGELIYGDPTDPEVFNKTTSALAKDGPEGVKLYSFDCTKNPFDPFIKRYELMQSIAQKNPHVIPVLHHLVKNEAEVYDLEKEYLDKGYEGLMGRSPYGQYKEGRSTPNDGILFKLKRFVDSEAIVLGFEEGLHNTNEAQKDAFGRTKRSSAKAGKIPNGTLGKLNVRDLYTNIEFNLSAFGTQEECQEVWNNRDKYLGKIVRYKKQLVGEKNRPRIASGLGWRLDIDL